jgi:single-strand DNA-binding protein
MRSSHVQAQIGYPQSKDLQMLNLNEVRLSGRLAEEPTIRTAMLGKISMLLQVAVERNWRDGHDTWHKEVAYVPVTVWDTMADYCGQRLRKGSPVYIEGRLRNDTWRSADGLHHSALRVHASRVQALQRKPANGGAPPRQLELEVIYPEVA